MIIFHNWHKNWNFALPVPAFKLYTNVTRLPSFCAAMTLRPLSSTKFKSTGTNSSTTFFFFRLRSLESKKGLIRNRQFRQQQKKHFIWMRWCFHRTRYDCYQRPLYCPATFALRMTVQDLNHQEWLRVKHMHHIWILSWSRLIQCIDIADRFPVILSTYAFLRNIQCSFTMSHMRIHRW